jgi:hypothetical protein
VRGKEWAAVCTALKGAGVDSVNGMREGMIVGASVGRKNLYTKDAKATKKGRGQKEQ